MGAVIDELVAFLRARLDQDERIARAVTTPGAWRVSHSHGGPTVEGDGWTVRGADELDAAHIAEHDPARVLKEVRAGRQAIAHYERVAAHRWKHLDYELAIGAVEVQLKIRALPYAGHEDYRQEWKP